MSDAEYTYFYLLGREEDEFDVDLDMEVLAQRVLDGHNLRDVAFAAAQNAAKPLESDRTKPTWLKANAEDIADCGGNGELAYRLYLQGRIDRFSADLESDIAEEAEGMLDDLDDNPEVEDDDELDDEPPPRINPDGVKPASKMSQQAKYRQWEAVGARAAADKIEMTRSKWMVMYREAAELEGSNPSKAYRRWQEGYTVASETQVPA